MNLTKELQEELIQVAIEQAGFTAFGSDLFKNDMDGNSCAPTLRFAIKELIRIKQYCFRILPQSFMTLHDSLKADITALENLLEEVQL